MVSNRSAEDGGESRRAIFIVALVLGAMALSAAGCLLAWFVRAGTWFVIAMPKAIESSLKNLPAEARQMGANLSDSRDATEAFLNELAAGLTDAAYNRTSQAFRKRYDAASFQDLARPLTLLRRPSLSLHYVPPEGASPATWQPINYEVTMRSEQRTLRCILRLIHENGSWKIDEFSVK